MRSDGIDTIAPGSAPDLPVGGTASEVRVNRGPNTRRAEIVAVTLVTLLGVILRLIAARHSLWYDELWTINFMRGGPMYAMTHQGSYNNHLLNSFLGSLLLRLRLLVTGLSPATGESVWWVRFPSLCFGACSVPLLYVTVRDSVNRPVGLCAAFLLAVSPVAIDLSAQSRGYAGVLCCGIAQAYFLARALKSGAGRDWMGWLLCAFVGVWAHLYMLFIVFVDSLLVVALIAGHIRKQQTPRALGLLKQGLGMLFAWLCLTVICYAGVLGALRREFGRVYENGPMARAHNVLSPMLQLWGGLPTGAGRIVFFALAALLPILGVWLLRRSRPSLPAYLIGLLFIPPVLVEIAHPHFVYPRFFAFALPAFLTLVACGLWQIAIGLTASNPQKQALRLALMPLGCLLFLLPGWNGLRDVLILPKQDYANAAARLAEAQRAHTPVAVVGTGCEYFKSYGIRPFYPRTVAELTALVRQNPGLLVADTGLIVNAHYPPPTVSQWLRLNAGPPVAIYPGRCANWPHRWLDGDSDVTIYELRADRLPKN